MAVQYAETPRAHNQQPSARKKDTHQSDGELPPGPVKAEREDVHQVRCKQDTENNQSGAKKGEDGENSGSKLVRIVGPVL